MDAIECGEQARCEFIKFKFFSIIVCKWNTFEIAIFNIFRRHAAAADRIRFNKCI